MKIVFKFINDSIELSSDYISSIVIENQDCFFSAVNDFISQDKSAETKLLIDCDVLPLSKKVETIIDFTNISLNNKKIQSRILSSLEEYSKDGENFIRTQEILSQLNKYLQELSEILPYGIEAKDLTFASILKSMGIKVVEDESPPIERLLQYMDFIRDLEGEKLFVLINLRSFFSDDVIESFYRMCEMKKFYVLLIESTSRKRLYNEKIHVLDSDMCYFV